MKIKHFSFKTKTSKPVTNSQLAKLSLSELSHVSGAPATSGGTGSDGGGAGGLSLR